MKVRAAVAREAAGKLRLETLELAEPSADEILVRIVACGVSYVDLDAIDGRLSIPFPFVPGSEGAGIVERVGRDVAAIAPGDAVILGFDFCGGCRSCLEGRPRACIAFERHNLAGRRLDGSGSFTGGAEPVSGHFYGQSSFATHAVCRASRAVKLAKGSPLEVLAGLGHEFLLGAGPMLEGFHLRDGDSLVVAGADAVGLAATMVAKAMGAGPIVLMEADERRRTLASELGADVAVHPDENLADLVRSLVAEGASFAVETTGRVDARRACVTSLAEGGRCAFRGDGLELEGHENGAPHVSRLEDHGPPGVLISKLAALHARGDLPLERLVDFFPFEHVNDALDALRGGTAPKPILRFSIGGFGELDRARQEGARHEAPDDAAASDNIEAKRPKVVTS